MPAHIPILAVLPFQVAGDDDRDSLLAQGLLEDICGELTRFRGLQVISWMSAQAVATQPDREIGARLGASHVLRGRLRRGGGRLRVNASLIDAAAGTQLWSAPFETAESEVFVIQDEMVAQIATSLVARLGETALEEARRRPTDSLAAYELTLQAAALLRQGTLTADSEARALLQRALELDPHYARAHAGMSLSWFNEWSCSFWDLFQENGQRAYSHAHRALELDDRDALLHVIIGKVLGYRREFDRAAWYFDRALALCPNDAEILIEMSISEGYLGRPALGVEHAERALRLNPYHPNFYYAYAAMAHAAAGNFETALQLAGPIDAIPIVDVPAYLAAAAAHLGRLEEGREHLKSYNALYRDRINKGLEPAPGEAAAWLLAVNPYRRKEDYDLLAEGFRLLGDPAPEPVTAATKTAKSEAAIFAQRGGEWQLSFDGTSVRLGDLKGLHDIARLLALPGEEIHCLDLAERGDEAYGGDAALDDKARAALKQRIRDLQEDVAEAEDMNDVARAEALRAELDPLVENLAKALGLGGRSRRLGSLSERARTTVTWRIRHALRKIEAVHPALGKHLANSLHTGSFCGYDPERAIDWQFTAETGSAASAGLEGARPT